jgi:drug/metabolite transporter (DMT)-like permease
MRGVFWLLVVNVLWGMSFPIMRVLHQRLPETLPELAMEPTDPRYPGTLLTKSLFLIATRFLLASAALAVVLPGLFRGVTRRQWWQGGLIGLVFGTGLVLQVMGLDRIPAARSGFLTALAVVFTPIAGSLLLRQRISRYVWLGAALALAGTAVLTGLVRIDSLHREPAGENLITLIPAPIRAVVPADAMKNFGAGDWLTIAAAAVFTVQILALDHFSKNSDSSRLTPGMFFCLAILACLGFLAAAPALTPETSFSRWIAGIDAPFVGLSALLVGGCTIAAFHLMNAWQSAVGPARAAVLYCTEPIFVTLWAVALPPVLSGLTGAPVATETSGPETLIGGAIVVIGTIITLLPERQPTTD